MKWYRIGRRYKRLDVKEILFFYVYFDNEFEEEEEEELEEDVFYYLSRDRIVIGDKVLSKDFRRGFSGNLDIYLKRLRLNFNILKVLMSYMFLIYK